MANTRAGKAQDAAMVLDVEAPKIEVAKIEAPEVETPRVEAAKIDAVNVREKPTVKEVDPNQYVTVRNGFQGRLVYVSKKTGEKYVWDAFGDEQDMELGELKRARSSAKKHFINNWFMFDEPWVVDYLGLGQYYKGAVKIEDFDKIFALPADKIPEAVSGMSAGQKRSAAYRARQLIAEGAIDSNKAITALEESLGVELVERA